MHISSYMFAPLTLLGTSKVLLGAESGELVCIDTSSGSILWSRAMTASAGISSGAAVEFRSSEQFPDGLPMENREGGVRVASCSNDGCLRVFWTLQEGDGVTELAAIAMPGDVFSSAVFCDSRIYVGCRDDHLYCLQVE